MENPDIEYRSLLSTINLDGFSNDRALHFVARLTDLSWDLGKIEGLRHAIHLSDELFKCNFAEKESALLHYYTANAWAGLSAFTRKGTETAWDWEQQELEKEIIHLRNALDKAYRCKLEDERFVQILTNLGNIMSNIGRFVEAIEYWEKALAICPLFGMARGNRGFGLNSYARILYDQGHIALFLKQAHTDLSAALLEPLDDNAKTGFENRARQIENELPQNYLARKINLDKFSLGGSKQEVKYRKWCLENRLFLNPLNDLGPYPIAGRDVLTTPSIVVNIGEGPYYHGFFNQMKQEFVSARFLYYEAINTERAHFSDNEVLLYNTLDYPSYSLSTEKMKAAFRTFYSLFDKVAFFLNHYLRLSIPEREITFRTFWYESRKKKKGLRPDFRQCPNWPLRGLFWLSKDLYENVNDFKEPLEPDAKELNEIRNHLEHKYLKLHDSLWQIRAQQKQELFQCLADTLAHSLCRTEFQEKTLRLAKMARAALIYLSLSIHCEERERSKHKGYGMIVPMPLDTWEDKWKL